MHLLSLSKEGLANNSRAKFLKEATLKGFSDEETIWLERFHIFRYGCDINTPCPLPPFLRASLKVTASGGSLLLPIEMRDAPKPNKAAPKNFYDCGGRLVSKE